MDSVTEAHVSKPNERNVSLGPFFLLGAALLVTGLIRRRPLASSAGIWFLWFDQRSEFGLEIKRRLDRRLKKEIKAHARERAAVE